MLQFQQLCPVSNSPKVFSSHVNACMGQPYQSISVTLIPSVETGLTVIYLGYYLQKKLLFILIQQKSYTTSIKCFASPAEAIPN